MSKSTVNIDISGGLSKTLKKKGHCLVFSFDGYVLCGAMVDKPGTDPSIRAVGYSTNLNRQNAIAEVISQLKNAGVKKIPKIAVMASPEAITGMVDIPVDPSKPKANAQMQELVRWEIEPQISEYVQKWTMANFLVQLGYLSHEDAQSVQAELLQRRGVGRQLIRFEEVAVDMNYLSRDQLNQAFVAQERMVALDGSMNCAWSPQSYRINDYDEEKEHLWYASALPDAIRHQWYQFFAKNKISLKQFYPLAGLSQVAIPKLSGEAAHQGEERLLLEVYKERIIAFYFNGHALVDIRSWGYEPGQLADTAVNALLEMQRPSTKQIYCACYGGDNIALAQLLSEEGKLHVQALPAPDMPSNNTVSAQGDSLPIYLIALANYFSGESSDLSVVMPLTAGDPKPPMWKNTDFWRVAIPVLVLGAVGVNEAYMQYRLKTAKETLSGTRADREKMAQERQQNTQLANLAKEEKNKYEQLDKEIKTIAPLLKQEELLFQRNNNIIDVLQSLASSVSPEVVVDKLIEPNRNYSKRQSFYLEGWAVSNTAAQRFSENLGRNVNSSGFTVRSVSISSAYGRHGAKGFGISLWLIGGERKTPPTPPAVPNTQTAEVK